MPREIAIPGGKAKGTPLTAANGQDIGYWLKRIEEGLKAGTSKYPDTDQAWVVAARAELARRKGGGAQQQAPAPASPPIQQQRPPSTSMAVRGSDKLAGSFLETNAAADALREAAQLYHLVSPATHCGMIPEGCGVAISMVHVDPNDAKDGPGEVHTLSGGKVGLSGTTLKKIAAAAAVDWDQRWSGRLDDGRDPHYCHYRAVGTVKNFDGSPRKVDGEVEIDAREGSPQLEEIRIKAEKRRREHPDWDNDGGASQILELRKFILRHAQTKAKLRAIADMGVKRSYTKAELQKPFAVARLMWTGQTKDPELRKLFAAKQFDAMVGSSHQLYGHDAALVGPQANRNQALPVATHSAPPLGSVREPIDDIEDDYDTRADEPPAADPPKQPAQPPATPPADQQKLEGLPPGQDRGDSAEDY